MSNKLTDVVVDSNVDGNVFSVVGAVSRELSRAGYDQYSKDVYERMKKCESYNAVLKMLSEYIT